ncbi:Hypothetical Protein FCC1311_003232 [Hondaea fermentalgiana]|uniref:Uncharacterized protein n=1 Tax=Hondaea fermentalgiana TaxID=2315210 RepID=A0A2R5G0Q9_9STRA|nr:Hypothetical Protein FCC1311_003232 [Hondaea fermentalgiana]|eukprot:GBG24105.1 Hypothetical Protein FCC1311_003232 [Hondaea fermentalgiana]
MEDDRVRRVRLEPAAREVDDAERILEDMAQALAATNLTESFGGDGGGSSGSGAQEAAAAAALSATASEAPADGVPIAGVPSEASPLSPPPVGELAGASVAFSPLRPRSQGRSRPRSRPQERPAAVQNVSAIASEQRSTSRKNLSRRKERRWANDRRAGAGPLSLDPFSSTEERGAFMEPGSSVPHGNLAAYFPDLDEFDVTRASRLIFEQEYISVFDGFTDEMRRAFLDCEDGFVRGGANVASERLSAKQRAQLTPRSAESMLARVDKNLKSHLQTRGRRPPFNAFLNALEDFLIEVIEDPCAHDLQARAPEPLRKALTRKLSLCGTPRSPHAEGEETPEVKRVAIEFAFKTGLHRLLTHGLCQFHGLVSQSATEPTTGARVLRISRPSKDSSMLGWATVETSSRPEDVQNLLFGEKVIRLVPYLATLPVHDA